MNLSNTLPVEQAKALAYADVMKRLGREPAKKGGRKFPCVSCESSDALHVDGYAKCFSCGRSFTAIDLVMGVKGLPFRDAVLWLADQFGILHYPASSPSRASRPSRASPDDPARHGAVYDALLGECPLTGPGLDYLAGRGLPYPDAAREVGIGYIDGRNHWNRIARKLGASFPPDALRAAIPARPFGGRARVLVLNYRWRGQVLALRFRNIDSRTQRDRYRDLDGCASPVPYMADALDDLEGHDLHVCEGELDAFALWGCNSRLRVIGIPGVGQLPGGPDAEWLRLAGRAERILCWHDQDTPGNEGAARLAGALQAANHWTPEELQRRVLRVELTRAAGGADVAELWQRGQLTHVVESLLRAAA